MKKHQKSGLGKSIINSLKKKEVFSDPNAIFTQPSDERAEMDKAKKLRSILQQNSLEEFLAEAELSSKTFEAKRDIKMKELRPQLESKRLREVDVKEDQQLLPEEREKVLNRIRIPRKPKWSSQDSRDQYINKENQAFLDWRRRLAEVEESELHLRLTPFQKNIEVWKQLWRVIDRAHLLIQIVDVRDIMFYRCQDLERYVQEVDASKLILLLINKSDLTTESIREQWATYLRGHKINFVFFSAKVEQESPDSDEQPAKFGVNSTQIANTHQLVEAMQSLSKALALGEGKVLQVGMLGYPNVGKSSVINALMKKKRVGVASQPGKTKHYQTLFLTPEIMLVDCPGLVFPNVASSVAEMVLNGVTPIDTIKDHIGPTQLLIRRIPKQVITKKYGLKFGEDEAYTAETLLQKYATMRGFFGGYGLPMQSRAARLILKDYTTGDIRFCRMPPGTLDESAFQQYLPDQQNLQVERPEVAEEDNKRVAVMQTEEKLDGNFFSEEKTVVSMGDVVKRLTMEDLLDLVDGKSAHGMKLPKEMRREVKFGIKRGETLEMIKAKYLLEGKVVDSGHQKMIKV